MGIFVAEEAVGNTVVIIWLLKMYVAGLPLRGVIAALTAFNCSSDMTDLKWQSIYKMPSEDGNPTPISLLSVLQAVGLLLSSL